MPENCGNDRLLTNVRLQGSEAVMALLNTAEGVSRVHAGRRFFDVLQEHGIDIPVIHQRAFQAGDDTLATQQSILW